MGSTNCVYYFEKSSRLDEKKEAAEKEKETKKSATTIREQEILKKHVENFRNLFLKKQERSNYVLSRHGNSFPYIHGNKKKDGAHPTNIVRQDLLQRHKDRCDMMAEDERSRQWNNVNLKLECSLSGMQSDWSLIGMRECF